MQNWREKNHQNILELVEIVSFFNQKGFSPATSTNYSLRNIANAGQIIISQSGVDKANFKAEHLMLINDRGMPIEFPDLKSSAETAIHTMLYKMYPKVQAVLHTHSLAATFLSMKANKNKLEFSGLELLKGLEGNSTHEMTEIVPIFENSQNIAKLAEEIEAYLKDAPLTHGFILKGHGLYTWGESLKITKRHVETFEFLFSYKLLEK